MPQWLESFALDLAHRDEKRQKKWSNTLVDLERGLSSIAHEIDVLLARKKEREIARKSRFNLFTLLRCIGDETGLHSRFIAYLLNPASKHDCGRLFLDLFLDTLNKLPESPDFTAIKSAECLEVRTEKTTDQNRRIDIYLEFQGYRIAIENKIWAGEQSNQISDYADFIGSDNEKNFLLYLTPNGIDSQTSNDRHYYPISYRQTILDWIESCLQATYEFPNINQALQQYKTTIQELTHQTLDHQAMNEIQQIICKNPKIIEHIDEINQAISTIKNKSVYNFITKTKNRLLEINNQYKVINLKDHGDIEKTQETKGHSWIKMELNNTSFNIGYDAWAKKIALAIWREYEMDENKPQIDTYREKLYDHIQREDYSSQIEIKPDKYWGFFAYLLIPDPSDSNFIASQNLSQNQTESSEFARVINDIITFLQPIIHERVNFVYQE
jgi:hypothetical protein